MKLCSLLFAVVASTLGSWCVNADNMGFDATVSDLAQATAWSYDVRAVTLGLDPATFPLEAPVIINGLYNITELGHKYIGKTRGAQAMDDEMAQSALYNLTFFVEAMRDLMSDLAQKRLLASDFSFRSQIAEALRSLDDSASEAESAFLRIVPTRVEEGGALYGAMLVAIEDAAKAYSS